MCLPEGDAAVAAFRQLTRRQPYKWQERLLRQWFIGSRMPEALDIPTGLGKTAAIALWLAALTVGIELPRRLVYVVDRRTVVDQASDEADRLASALGEAEGVDPAVNELRRSLRLGKRQRLPVSTLRGQHLDNRLWLEDPVAPAIVVGTVDMIGSRLLFEGYGVSPRMRPVHAGLIGADALVMLDEAHLVPPFAALLRSIAEMRAPAPVPRFHLMTLSATGREQGCVTGTGRPSFGLEAEDWDDPPVRARLDAVKRLLLEPNVETKDLPALLADRAWQLGENGKLVIVYCNRRTVAHEVRNRIEEILKKNGMAGATELLVGARRVHEREKLKNSSVFRRFDPNAPPEEDEGAEPAFLVATSAGEVGVDLDADHMVCDLVPWERMVQRLGRVNRRERPGIAKIDVFPAPSERDLEPEIDKDRLARLRAPFDSAVWPIGADGRREASPGVLHRLKNDPTIQPILQTATSEEPLRPAFTRALADAWSMTSLPEHPGRPNVEPWLRGWVEDEAQTRIVWRRLLPVRPGDEEPSRRDALKKILNGFFEYAPPRISEILETLTRDVVDMLQKRSKALADAKSQGKLAAELPLVAVAVLSARGAVDNVLPLWGLHQPRDQLIRTLSGRTVVLDARLGGLDAAGLLDPATDTPPPTLDGDPDDPNGWREQQLRAVGFRVRQCGFQDEPSDGWRIAAQWLRDPDAAESAEDPSGFGTWRVEIWPPTPSANTDPAIGRRDQLLHDHHRAIKKWAERIARGLDLPDEYRRVLVAAAGAHDLGKARDNWQRFARNAGFAQNRDAHPALAKFEGRGDARLLDVDGQTYRHEFGSLRDAENRAVLRKLPDDLRQDAIGDLAIQELRDLALHLVAAHHGFARPVIAAVDPDHAPSASAALARETALRFSRLQARWGPWGLAWWEALLRAADWAASRELNEQAAGIE